MHVSVFPGIRQPPIVPCCMFCWQLDPKNVNRSSFSRYPHTVKRTDSVWLGRGGGEDEVYLFWINFACYYSHSLMIFFPVFKREACQHFCKIKLTWTIWSWLWSFCTRCSVQKKQKHLISSACSVNKSLRRINSWRTGKTQRRNLKNVAFFRIEFSM